MLDTGSRSQPSTENRFSGCVFLALIALEVTLVWAFPYFPSEDGPSHLHNASVLANYDRESIYREYYRLTPFRPAGNMLTQFVLAGLLKLTGVILAEKLLLTGYVILLPVSFRYLLCVLTRRTDFSLFAFVLVPNYFLYMGLWNFCYSIGFLLLTLGFYFEHVQGWTPRSIAVLGVGGLVVYLTHAVSWVICLIAIAGWGLVQLIADVWGERGPALWAGLQKGLRQYGLPLCVLLPPALLMLTHLIGSKEQSGCGGESSWRVRLHPLYRLAFLHGITNWDAILAKVVAATLIVLFAFAAVFSVRRERHNWCSFGVLVVSATCAVLAVFGPDCIGTGLFIHKRVGLYACSFFVVWLAMQSWPQAALRVISLVFCAIALSSFMARLPVHRRLSRGLSEFVEVGQKINPQTTVLLVELHPRPEGSGKIWPYEHAVGLLSERVVIDLSNYEALTDYFSTSFWPERSPSPALGTAAQLEAVPPVFDIPRYESETRGRVDYVMVLGNSESIVAEPEREEIQLYGKQMTMYRTVSSSQDGSLRLYQRSAP
jgi:hypothetical protein